MHEMMLALSGGLVAVQLGGEGDHALVWRVLQEWGKLARGLLPDSYCVCTVVRVVV